MRVGVCCAPMTFSIAKHHPARAGRNNIFGKKRQENTQSVAHQPLRICSRSSDISRNGTKNRLWQAGEALQRTHRRKALTGCTTSAF
eukprot:3236570-Amphidinium_carterae.1